MTSRQKPVLAAVYAANVPTIFWGPPGVGKTSAVLDFCRGRGLPVEVVIASIREPSDFLGLPVVDRGAVKYAPPAWAVRLAQAGRGVLFLDEISCAAPAVQAALLRVVLERVVGELNLPPSIRIWAAANPPELAAGGWELSPPMANRFVHLNWPEPGASWVDCWVSATWPSGQVAELRDLEPAQIAAARRQLGGFLKSRPQLINRPAADQLAFPTPRSWDMAARLLAAGRAMSLDWGALQNLIAGAVGAGVAAEVVAWLVEHELPQAADWLADPACWRPRPDRPDKASALLAEAVSIAIRDIQAHWAAAWACVQAVADVCGLDVVVPAARALIRAWRPGLEIPEIARRVARATRGDEDE